jgi:hypothetical protein
MPKTLKDIITPERAGRNIPKGEEDFLDAHKVAETDYPVKQKTANTHTASTEHKPDSKHGYTKPEESEKVYKATNEEKKYKRSKRGKSPKSPESPGSPGSPGLTLPMSNTRV